MPAAASYSPAAELYGSARTLVIAQTNNDLLDQWHLQTVQPFANTPMGAWMMAQRGYVPPTPAGTTPTTGRIWPR